MKAFLVVPLLMALPVLAYSQTDERRVGRVLTFDNDIQVFFYNEPVSEYITTFSFKEKRNGDCTNWLNVFLDKAQIEAGLQEKAFDAVIINKEGNDYAIRWVNPAQDNGLARISEERGVLIYYHCLPVLDYDTVREVKAATVEDWGSFACLRTMEKMVSSARKSKSDAVIMIPGKVNLVVDIQ